MSTQEIITEIRTLIEKLKPDNGLHSLLVQSILLVLCGARASTRVDALSDLTSLFAKEEIHQHEYSNWMREG